MAVAIGSLLQNDQRSRSVSLLCWSHDTIHPFSSININATVHPSFLGLPIQKLPVPPDRAWDAFGPFVESSIPAFDIVSVRGTALLVLWYLRGEKHDLTVCCSKIPRGARPNHHPLKELALAPLVSQ